jgi:hypothetical protein
MVVGIVTKLLAGRSGVRIPLDIRDFSLHQNLQTGTGSNQPSIQWVPASFADSKVEGREVNHAFHLMSRLRMSGAILVISFHGVDREIFTITPSRT